MATMAPAARDIAATSARDNLTVVAARSVPVTRPPPHPISLPTPPNSISPALPPHGLKAQLAKASAAAVGAGTRLDPIDSDLDLMQPHDDDHDGSSASPPPSGASYYLDSYGAITPALLAKHHLPDILLNNGPLAIRHIMGYLTTSVPGFAGIPPAKARRLVVGALEGRGGSAGTGSEGNGPDGDVEFEKVGWGRWDARRRGHPRREQQQQQQQQQNPNGRAIPIGASTSVPTGWNLDRPVARGGGGGADTSGGSTSSTGGGGAHSATFSHDGHDMAMMDNEADKMSMDGNDDDGSASASCSEAPDDQDVTMRVGDDPEDLTDEEDWAAVGAAALRAASYSNSGGMTQAAPPGGRGALRSGGPGFLSSRAFSSGATDFGPGRLRPGLPGTSRQAPALDFAGFNVSTNSQEREAVEALLRLGSV